MSWGGIQNVQITNVLKAAMPADVVVYKEGSKYFAKNDQDEIVAEGTDAEVVIQAALDNTGDVNIRAGTYTMPAGFDGFTLPDFTRLHMHKSTIIVVPNGYSGAVFVLDGSNFCVIEGGRINEAGVDQRLWAGIRCKGAAGAGTAYNSVRDMYIAGAAKGIEMLLDDATAFASANEFKNINIYDSVVGVDFNSSVTPTTGGMSGNLFDQVIVQSTVGVATHGFKDIRYRRNCFVNCQVYDMTGAQITANIHVDAQNTMIFGGSMTNLNYADSGSNTQLVDAFNGNLILQRDQLDAVLRMDSYGSSVYPKIIGRQASNTSASPQATASGAIIAALIARGHNGSAFVTTDRAAVELTASQLWTGTAQGTFINWKVTPNGTATGVSSMRLHNQGDLALKALAKLLFDGVNGAGNTFIQESAADTLDIVAGGAVAFQALSNRALAKAYSDTSDPTATEIPAGYFTVAKNTTSGAVKLFYNDSGSLKSVELT